MTALEPILKWVPAAMRPVVLQFAGYIAVSGTAFIVDFSIYWMLLQPLQFAVVAAIGGYLAGVVTHYLLSSRIVFARHLEARGIAAETPIVAKFLAAGATGLAVTAATVGLLADVFGMHPVPAKLIATGLSFICVFNALRLFVFEPRGR